MQQRQLREMLTDENLPARLIQQEIASAYVARNIRDLGSTEGRSAVMDNYYKEQVVQQDPASPNLVMNRENT